MYEYETIPDEIIGVLDQQNVETEYIETTEREIDLENTGFLGRLFNNYKYKDVKKSTPIYKITSNKKIVKKSGKIESI